MKKIVVLVLATLLLTATVSAEARTKFGGRNYNFAGANAAIGPSVGAFTATVVDNNVKKDVVETATTVFTYNGVTNVSVGQVVELDQAAAADTFTLVDFDATLTNKNGTTVYDFSTGSPTVTGQMKVLAVDTTNDTALVQVTLKIKNLDAVLGANTKQVNRTVKIKTLLI